MSETCVVLCYIYPEISEIFIYDMKKDGVRPGEPGYDPRTLFVPKSAWKEVTPFEKQV